MALVLAALVGTATSYSWPHFIALGLISVASTHRSPSSVA